MLPIVKGDTVVAQAAIGPRYQKIKDLTRRKLSSNDVLAVVAQKKKPRFVRDSRTDPTCDNLAVRNSGIISQYIIPMETLDGLINAILQIDVGDASYKPDLHATEKEVLDALGTIVSSNLNRIFNWQQSKIMRKLDRAFKESLSAATVEDGLQKYLEAVVQAFGLEMGHIRIEDPNKNSLVLVASTGHYYEIARQHRKEIDIGDWSPTALAFRDESLIVVNDAVNNKMHQEMSRRPANDPSLRAELKKVGSYASMPFKSEQGKRGTISLVSRDAWFFNWFHERTFPALAERVSFLVEYLRSRQDEVRRKQDDEVRRKQNEEEAQRQIRFLLDVSPNLNAISPNQTDQVLTDVTKRFAEAVNAEVASLYLFDTVLNIYVLQAEYNWQNKDLVGRANYGKDDGWVGVRALKERPRLIPNLYRYYQEQNYPTSNRYDCAMFSQPLSEDFTVEVIGIPLKVRNEEIGVGRLVDDGIAEGVPLKVGKKDIGVLALYREIKEGQSSGFATIAPNILQEGANNLASLVSVLISEKNRQAMQAKISLVAQSSHEFKGLLRNLKSMPKKLQEASEKANKAELEAEINRVIRDTNSDLGIDPAKSNIEKDLKELQDLMVIIDPDLMGEALRNLISNAMNSMPQGGKVKICARPDLEKRNAIITISDTGIGMSRKKLESVRRCLSGEGKGTGWGLAIASSQISLQGGTIVIDSEKGRGTTVTVTLPLSPKED